MAERSTKITKRSVDAIKADGSDFYVFDTELIGFGIRVRASGAMSYIVRYRAGYGRSAPVRRVTIAKVGKITPDQARKSAEDILASVVKGSDPAKERADDRSAATFKELVGYFLEHIEAKKSANTLSQYRQMLEGHAIPEMGTRRAFAIQPGDIAALHHAMRGTPVAANRTRSIISSMFSWAIKRKILTTPNPVQGIDRYKEEGQERFLTSEELARLAEALREAETVGIPWEPDPARKTKHAPKPENRRTKIDPHVAAAIRLLIFTGARLREILHLKWANIDFERGLLLLEKSKTGKKPIVLGAPALAILAELPRVGSYVIAGATAGKKNEKPRADLKRPWMAVRKRAGLGDLRIHDLRHSYASVGVGGGMGLPIVGRLLGHKSAATTAKYAHLHTDPLRKATDAIGVQIAAAMGETKTEDNVVPIRREAK